MTVEQLRKAHQAQPFEPFVVRTGDGREFRVSHPEVLAVSPAGRTIVIMTAGGAHEVIDLLLVTSLRVGDGQARGPRRRR
jgi:hypothetical protein